MKMRFKHSTFIFTISLLIIVLFKFRLRGTLSTKQSNHLTIKFKLFETSEHVSNKHFFFKDVCSFACSRVNSIHSFS